MGKRGVQERLASTEPDGYVFDIMQAALNQ
jgi:hypothetical protein